MSAVLVVVLLGRIEPTKRFAVALARGARPGVRMILASISASTASNDAVNFASRSRITNRKRGQHPWGPCPGCGPDGSSHAPVG